MNLSPLTAISPVDGRYRRQTQELAAYFSEYALIRYRVQVEVEYFIALCELPLPQLEEVNATLFPKLRAIYEQFTEQDALQVKEVEKTTNHDVKAVEYFLKRRFTDLEMQQWLEFIHFGLTSQDINNTATPLSLKLALEQRYYPVYNTLVQTLNEYAEAWKNIPMLARTHGQPASPTRLGKEVKVFIERLHVQMQQLRQIPFSAKFGGATGNFNAHKVAYPQVDWIKFANNLVDNKLGLSRSQTTTQIEHYDNLAAIFDALKRINTILIDLSRDVWTYISMGYFKQKIKSGEVGSSAMPHKVNPIDFENAEGNLGIANALLEHLAAKLPISRLQRDLTDSTALRNVGVPMAHTAIAFASLQKGLGKLIVDEQAIAAELDNNWAVVAEGVQTILRREGYPQPYEALKALTRTHQHITQQSMLEFINSLSVNENIKAELRTLSPNLYTGY
ncbi:MAG: adenylosuccinate lyase [Prevotellaceae bacterium]|jgi:adenylosuccinate lyase|nr:adenylosuccinate lyase [Prevotellaceae bacterium]